MTAAVVFSSAGCTQRGGFDLQELPIGDDAGANGGDSLTTGGDRDPVGDSVAGAPCAIEADCDDSNSCSIDLCDDGRCRFDDTSLLGVPCTISSGDDGRCVAAATSTGTACQALLVDGQPCSSDGECLSNFCVDAFCCAQACDGECERCDVAGLEGSCSLDDALCGTCGTCAEWGTCDLSCDDGDLWTVQDTCVADVCAGTLIDPAGYAIANSHFSSSISHAQNRIKLMSLHRTPTGGWSGVLLEDMGSFKDSPLYWDVLYTSSPAPPLCYSRTQFHSGTIWEGLNQGYFPARTKADLVTAIRQRLFEPYTYRWPSNASGGDLCTSGNWWTEVIFTADGATHVETLLASP